MQGGKVYILLMLTSFGQKGFCAQKTTNNPTSEA